MIICEVALGILLVILLAIASYTDCAFGIVQNKVLLMGTITSLLINIPYFLFWAGDFFPTFISNAALLSGVAMLLYLCHIWAAGDSKLLIVIGFCLPGRLLVPWDIGPFPAFAVVLASFSFAFIYMLLESAYLMLARKDRGVSMGKVNWRKALPSYLFVSSITALLSHIGFLLFPAHFSTNSPLLAAAQLAVALLLAQLRDRLDGRAMACASSAILLGYGFACAFLKMPSPFALSVRSFAISLLVLATVFFANRHNYTTVPTSTVKAGQILSAGTVLLLSSSRIRGLPQGATEDIRSRITEDEAESVRRWGHSARGRDSVVIVRKIPFAVFIAFGTIAFLGIEVAMLWH